MYLPQHFNWEAPEQIAAFIADYNFGTLITGDAGRQSANHVPFLPRLAENHLDGHLARANPDAAQPGQRQPALAVFSGPHAYISPRWYTNPSQVPTWNYLAVHVHGELEWLQANETQSLLDELTAFHEQASQKTPWTTQELSPQRLEKLMAAVAPFRLHVSEIRAKAKLGQNKSRADQEAVAAALDEAQGNGPLLEYLRRVVPGA
ncbi:MAG: FMN-binding negative transcriptional regulator [Gammaproteobacteria bacterium]|nr:FMN-binding negative transcriptional regulator [Gammaproteobacteria bacterium]